MTKRWMRHRLAAGLKPVSLVHQLRAIEELSAFLDQAGVGDQPAGGPQNLDREVIERFLAWLPSRFDKPKTRGGLISAVAAFLLAVRQHGWAPDLPATATVYSDDYPKHELSAPRSLSEYVMAQLEDPANLDRWRRAENRLVTRIMMATGLRVGDACALAPDCLAHDHDGAPYLRYRNHKMRRDAVVPISTELAAAIEEHQQVMRTTIPVARYLLLAAVANPDGTRPMSTAGYRNSLRDWLATCNIHDEHGRAVHVTPHQWRHTYGTRLINSEVPQEVVRRLLDHSSHQMTSHYARLTDRTIRQQWERARKVDSSGRDITAQVDGPHADADWMKHNLARAKMALPNGYCGLPLQQSCPHANACLTCPVFITTPQFLPQHHEHLAATRRLIATAEADGQFRLVEMNQQVAGNLERVITALQPADEGPAADAR